MVTNKRVNWPVPTTDEPIEITLDNVYINGQSNSFNYTVYIIDSEEPGGSEFTNSLSTSGDITMYASNIFQVTTRPWSEGVQGRIFKTGDFSEIYDAESTPLPFYLGISDSYPPVTTGFWPSNQTNVYHLAQPDSNVQTMTLMEEFYIEDNSPVLEFDSSFGFMTEYQYGSVDIKLGDGYNWQSIYKFNGPKSYDGSFNQQTIDLSEWIGRTAQFRFRLQWFGSAGDPWESGVSYSSGWVFDNVTLSGVSKLLYAWDLPAHMNQNSFAATFTESGPIHIQARDIAFTELDPNGFALDWGPALEVNPVADGFTLADTPLEAWTNHATIGWTYRVNADWAYTIAFGWAHIGNGPWLFTEIGWVRYISGNINTGMWLYSMTEGFIYTHATRSGQFLRSPFTGSWSTFGQ